MKNKEENVKKKQKTKKKTKGKMKGKKRKRTKTKKEKKKKLKESCFGGKFGHWSHQTKHQNWLLRNLPVMSRGLQPCCFLQSVVLTQNNMAHGGTH